MKSAQEARELAKRFNDRNFFKKKVLLYAKIDESIREGYNSVLMWNNTRPIFTSDWELKSVLTELNELGYEVDKSFEDIRKGLVPWVISWDTKS